MVYYYCYLKFEVPTIYFIYLDVLHVIIEWYLNKNRIHKMLNTVYVILSLRLKLNIIVLFYYFTLR
jgi:hypothetical protein